MQLAPFFSKMHMVNEEYVRSESMSSFGFDSKQTKDEDVSMKMNVIIVQQSCCERAEDTN